MNKILADTDILIDYSKGFKTDLGRILGAYEREEAEVYISSVNVVEFLNDKSLKDKDKYNQALEFLRIFLTVDIGRQVGEVAGKLLREAQVDYLGDALIAACCLDQELQLMSRNKKHFAKVKGLIMYQA